jgi:hypothetical protein
MLTYAKDIEMSFAKMVTDRTVEQCMKCHKIGIEDSKVNFGPLEPKDPQKPPALLHLTDTSQSTFANVCILPRAVKIGDNEYHQTMVVQYKSDKGGHFNALINLDREWLKYDSIDQSLKDDFIQIARPRDFASDDW